VEFRLRLGAASVELAKTALFAALALSSVAASAPAQDLSRGGRDEFSFVHALQRTEQ
jgi:hypothetical protein